MCVVGFDISAPEALRRNTPRALPDLRKAFHKQFTEREWTSMELAGPRGPGAAESIFRLHWSLKEAIVKARGDGIVFDLQRIELSFPRGHSDTHVCSAMTIDGTPAPLWDLHSHMHADHWLSVARCRPAAILDAHGEFTRTMRSFDMDEASWAAAIAAPVPAFQTVTVRDLLPAAIRAAYDELVGPAM
jgi:4'-phosphopantetheinyl transferase